MTPYYKNMLPANQLIRQYFNCISLSLLITLVFVVGLEDDLTNAAKQAGRYVAIETHPEAGGY